MAKSARNRSRAPNGMRAGALPAACRAGQVKLLATTASRSVTRNAWRISPLDASAALARNGVIGRPAASPEVQPDGRSASDFRSQAAVDSAYHWPPSW
jgi:hypothetical protein